MKLLLDADVLIGALDRSDAHHERARELLVGARERQRGRHPISLPDAYLLASAKHAGAAVGSFDGRVQQAAQLEGLTSLG